MTLIGIIVHVKYAENVLNIPKLSKHSPVSNIQKLSKPSTVLNILKISEVSSVSNISNQTEFNNSSTSQKPVSRTETNLKSTTVSPIIMHDIAMFSHQRTQHHEYFPSTDLPNVVYVNADIH